MKTLLLLQGIPASGKTTFAKALQKSEPHWKRVNLDDLRSMVDSGVWSHDNERLIQRIHRDMIYTLLKRGHDVIVDNTHMNSDAVKRIHEIARDVGDVTVKTVPLSVPMAECIQRNALRTARVPDEAIHRMARKKLSEPSETYHPHEYPAAALEQDENLPQAIICDLDGTLALMNGRSPYDASTCDRDLPNKPIVWLVREMWRANCRIIFVSGRMDKYRQQTQRFIETHLPSVPYELYMRNTDDSRKDHIVKREIYDAHIRGKVYVHFVLDDRNRVVAGWRKLGLTCLQVAEGDF